MNELLPSVSWRSFSNLVPDCYPTIKKNYTPYSSMPHGDFHRDLCVSAFSTLYCRSISVIHGLNSVSGGCLRVRKTLTNPTMMRVRSQQTVLEINIYHRYWWLPEGPHNNYLTDPTMKNIETHHGEPTTTEDIDGRWLVAKHFLRTHSHDSKSVCIKYT